MTSAPARRVDPDLVRLWLSGRSLCRQLPQPIPDQGGWRVETASAAETRRYVFAAPVPGLRALAEKITDPRIVLKLCGSEDEMRAAVARGWVLQPRNHMMIRAGRMAARPVLPSGFRLAVSSVGAVVSAEIRTRDGDLAASGFAATVEQCLSYDRIVTEPAYRRMGLGCAVMAALQAAHPDASMQILVATDDGRALYASLGWTIHSPYITASRPPRVAESQSVTPRVSAPM